MRTIKTTPVQEKAMAYVAVDPQQWIQNAWDNRARLAMDQIIRENTDRQPEKISQVERDRIIRDTRVKTLAQRQAEFEEIQRTRQ